MGGTVDGNIYEYLDEKEKAAIEKLSKQELRPLIKSEVELAKQIDDKEERARLFRETSNEELENQMRDFLNRNLKK
jgi:hypothetical protein